MSETYNPPDSNPDPYSTTTTTSPPIDLSTLPRPLPLLGPLTGYTPANITLGIQKRLLAVSQTISRPLTPDETTALTYSCAKSSAIASYGPSLGIALGAYRTYATRKEFRWPFYGKIISDELGTGFWDGEKMRLNGKEILAGVSKEGKANILHTARGMAYVTIALAVVPVFVSSYAAAVAGTSEMRDVRLKSVTREMVAAVKAERDERVAKIKGQRGGGGGGGGQTTEQVGGGEVWKERRERMGGGSRRVEREAATEAGDEMSPTGGAMLDYGVDTDQGDTSVLSDSQLQPQPSPSPFQRRPTPTPSPTYDSASPTAGRGMLDDTFPSTSDSSDSTGLSTWERIRQQNASGETPSPSSSSSSTVQQRWGGRRGGQKQQQQEDGGGGDGFTFSREDEERGYARAEAQREFDDRLERERRGGSFGGNE